MWGERSENLYRIPVGYLQQCISENAHLGGLLVAVAILQCSTVWEYKLTATRGEKEGLLGHEEECTGAASGHPCRHNDLWPHCREREVGQRPLELGADEEWGAVCDADGS